MKKVQQLRMTKRKAKSQKKKLLLKQQNDFNINIIDHKVSINKTQIPIKEEKECRICLEDKNLYDNRLVRPCLCKGTAEWIHIVCLIRWRENCKTANQMCPICGYHYQSTVQTLVFINELIANVPLILFSVGMGFMYSLIRAISNECLKNVSCIVNMQFFSLLWWYMIFERYYIKIIITICIFILRKLSLPFEIGERLIGRYY